MITLWLAAAYKALGAPDDREIVFKSAGDILTAYDLPTNSGAMYMRLRERIARLFAATIIIDDCTPGSGLRRGTRNLNRERYLRRDSYRPMETVDLWFSSGCGNQYTLWQNRIKLTERFASDIRDNAIPCDLQTVKAFKSRASHLDLYLWQSWRSWRLSQTKGRDVRIPLCGKSGLLSHLVS